MPKREDDYWANQDEGLRYCSKHKHYYRADIGCQRCWLEKNRNITHERESQKVHECPVCKTQSLYDAGIDSFICLNQSCQDFGKYKNHPIIETPKILDNKAAAETETKELKAPTEFLKDLSTGITQPSPVPLSNYDNVAKSSPSVHLQTCPSCKRQSLKLNEAAYRYECISPRCGYILPKILIDRYDAQVAADKKALNELTSKDTKAWSGNRYYDSIKKKWINGPYKRKRSYSWWWIIPLILIVASGVVTLFIHLLSRGTTVTFFGW